MKDENKTKAELISELKEARRRVAELEKTKPPPKKTEKDLRENGGKFRSFAENTPDYIVQIDRKGKIIFTNRTYEGVSIEDVVGSSVYNWLPKEQNSKVKNAIRHVFDTGESDVVEYSAENPQGETLWHSVSFGAIETEGKVSSAVLVIRDITEHKLSEGARTVHLRFLENMERIDHVIRQANNVEQMMSDVLQTTLDMFETDRAWLLYPCDPDAESWNVPMERTRPEFPGAFALGEEIPMLPEGEVLLREALDKDDVITLDTRDPGAPKETAKRFSVFAQMHMPVHPRTGKPWLFGIQQCSHYRDWTDEEKDLFREIGHRLGDALSILLFLRDLRKSESSLREAQRVAHIGSWTHDLVRDKITWSDEMFRTVGIERQELNSELIFSLIHPDDTQIITHAMEESQEGKAEADYQFRIVRPSGEVRWIHNRWVSTYDETGREIKRTGTNQDITKRKRAEEEKLALERQLQHAQKLESLGVLAGGIAHDFNNVLMTILGNADLALNELSPMSPVRGNLQVIEKASRCAAELAKQMLAYSGKGQFVVEPIDAGELLGEMAHMLEVLISRKTTLKYNFAENLPTFDGDATQIHQVVMNLITNASEAIGDRIGVIALSTGAINCDRAYLDNVNEVLRVSLNEPLPEGVYVYFEVADTGCGIDASTIEKIFDPFFTTKFTGRGLGMSVVLGIVRGHKGTITIFSETGKGTTFKVLFPANKLSANYVTKQSNNEADVKEWRGTGTILIADDEEAVRAVCRRMLERMGFSVLTASDGREALKVFSQHTDEIVCVLLDLTMPHLNGFETFREMRHLYPGVTVILCSGYNEQEVTQRFAGKGLTGFIQKPYSMSVLKEKLMVILSEGQSNNQERT